MRVKKASHAVVHLEYSLLTGFVYIPSHLNPRNTVLRFFEQEKNGRASINWERRQGRIIYCSSGKFAPHDQEVTCRD